MGEEARIREREDKVRGHWKHRPGVTGRDDKGQQGKEYEGSVEV